MGGTYVGGGCLEEKTCRGVALGGGDVKVGALALGGPMPVVTVALGHGGVVVQIGLSLGCGLWRPVVCLGGGARVFAGGSLMIMGARESVF